MAALQPVSSAPLSSAALHPLLCAPAASSTPAHTQARDASSRSLWLGGKLGDCRTQGFDGGVFVAARVDGDGGARGPLRDGGRLQPEKRDITVRAPLRAMRACVCMTL